MQTEPINVTSIATLVARRRRISTQRRTRQLLLRAIRVEPARTKGPRWAAAILRMDGDIFFLASPELDDIDLKTAAYALAYRGLADDAVSFSLLRRLRKNVERVEDPAAFVETNYVGLSPEANV